MQFDNVGLPLLKDLSVYISSVDCRTFFLRLPQEMAVPSLAGKKSLSNKTQQQQMIFSMAPTRLKRESQGVRGERGWRDRGRRRMGGWGVQEVVEAGERGETFHSATVWETGREIIACLRAAILGCAMNTKHCNSPSLSLFPVEDAAEFQLPTSYPETLTYSPLKTTQRPLSAKSTHNYSLQTYTLRDPTRTDTFFDDSSECLWNN